MGRLALLVAAVIGLALAACGGSEPSASTTAGQSSATTGAAGTGEPSEAEPEPVETGVGSSEPDDGPALEAGLPEAIAGYQQWPRLNAEPIPPRDADPHFGTKDVYASEAAGADGLYPDGTVIVKEAIEPDTDFVYLVAIMRKEAGSDPAHNDWQFVEYTRPAAGEPFSELASGEVCWSCHVGAEKTDYVFTTR